MRFVMAVATCCAVLGCATAHERDVPATPSHAEVVRLVPTARERASNVPEWGDAAFVVDGWGTFVGSAMMTVDVDADLVTLRLTGLSPDVPAHLVAQIVVPREDAEMLGQTGLAWAAELADRPARDAYLRVDAGGEQHAVRLDSVELRAESEGLFEIRVRGHEPNGTPADLDGAGRVTGGCYRVDAGGVVRRIIDVGRVDACARVMGAL